MGPRTVIAADLGGTFLRAGVVTADREILHQVTRLVGDRRGASQIEPLIRETLVETYAWTRANRVAPEGVGLAVPGLIDGAHGRIRYSTNLDVRDLAVAEVVRAVVPLPIVVENDVRAAAWGEWRWGAGRGASSVALLSAGTGIAAALVSGGRLYRGAAGAAGELGHVPVIPEGITCRCGRVGCLETVAGGWGIVRQVERRSAERLAGAPGPGGVRPTTEGVFRAAVEGDPVAAAVVEQAGVYMGWSAVALVRLWNPERLLLGGGLFFSGSPLVVAVERAVAASTLYGDVPPPVALCAFGGNAGLIGAACLVLEPVPPDDPENQARPIAI